MAVIKKGRTIMRIQFSLSLIFFVVVCEAALAQRDYGPEFRALPSWPSNGIISPKLQSNYVFLDREAGQMVLSYPENLGRSDFKNNPGLQKVEYFDLNNQVNTSFSVDIKKVGQQFTYHYSVSNAQKAKRAVDSFSIVVPKYGNDDSITAPANWKAAGTTSKIHAVQLAIGQSSGAFLTWYSLDWNASVIKPGSELQGFQVTAALKPGFTLAYVRGGGFDPNLRESMPREVLEQSVPILQVEHNSQNVVTLAPRFDADTPITQIASNFHQGINHMIDHGQLDGDSPAIIEALQLLGAYSGEADHFDFEMKPNPGLEAAVLNAMKLSMNHQ
jgi:hypothetical protein